MSTKGLLKSMVVIGSAQFASIMIRIARAKLVALMLGPAGTGLLAVFLNLRELGSNAAGLGLPVSGVRELAAAQENTKVLSRVRSVLVLALALQGGLAMAVIWALRVPLGFWLIGNDDLTVQIGLVGVAVFVFLLALSQQTLLQGMRRIADLGRVMVLGTLVGTLAGLSAVWILGMQGLIWFILAESLGALIIAYIYARRLPPPSGQRPGAMEMLRQWQPMVRLGLAFMLGGLVSIASLLILRSHITRELGLDAAGQFAAAWTIGIIYIGFLLDAMGKDYFPRLSAVIHDQPKANALMNDQMQLGLALGGPVLIFMIGVAPWAVQLLYSADFVPAAELVQWQMAANIFKLAAWVMGFSFIAAGRSKLFLAVQVQFNALLLVGVWLGLPLLGLKVTGVSILLATIWHFCSVAVLAHYLTGFRWQKASVRLLILHTTLVFTLLLTASIAPIQGAILAISLAIFTALVGVRIIIAKLGRQSAIVLKLAYFYDQIGWPVKDPEGFNIR